MYISGADIGVLVLYFLVILAAGIYVRIILGVVFSTQGCFHLFFYA